MQKIFFHRCIRFDNKHIVSGAYDGKIKVWDLQAALDPRKPSQALCIRTLMVSGLLAKKQISKSVIRILENRPTSSIKSQRP